jgi:hypothetical protein
MSLGRNGRLSKRAGAAICQSLSRGEASLRNEKESPGFGCGFCRLAKDP